jgi:hypothetical protein
VVLRRLGALVGAYVEGREGRLRLELALARAELADARREAARLRRLFDDAGEGQYNVLALIEGYQERRDEAERERDKWHRCALQQLGKRDAAADEAFLKIWAVLGRHRVTVTPWPDSGDWEELVEAVTALHDSRARWRERVEPAEARAAELAAKVGTLSQAAEVVALRERLAEEQERRGRAESAMGTVVQRLCGGAPRSLQEVLAAVHELEARAAGRHGVAHQALSGLIERVCGRPNMTLDDAYAALGTLKAQRDGAQRDAAHFREQAINREEELHRLKEATALKVGEAQEQAIHWKSRTLALMREHEEAVRQAVAADRASVAEWLFGLRLIVASDAGGALRGDFPWVPPPPPVNPSTPSKSSATESEAPHA